VNPRVRVLATLVAAASVVLAVLLVSRIEPTPRAPSSPRTAAPRSASPSATTSARPSASGSNPSGSSAGPSGNLSSVRIALQSVATGLDSPVFVGNAGDGSGRLFVIEQAGRIRIVQNGKLASQPFLDIRDRVSDGGERGLLGLAFHPGYGKSGESRFYVDYTDLKGDTVIAEYRGGASGDPNRADPASEKVLLHIDQPFPNHNGGGTLFGPDGFLYVTTGDAKNGPNAQNLN